MIQAELERSITREIEDKPARNDQKTSLTAQLSDTVGVLDSVISELRSSQNGDEKENAIANQLITSLTEIRGNTLRQNPVIVWQSLRIPLKGSPVVKEPKQAPIERKAPVAREKTKSQPNTEILEGYITSADFYKTIGMGQVNWSRRKDRYPQVRTVRRGYFKFFNEGDAESIKQIREIKKAEITAKKTRPVRFPKERKVSMLTKQTTKPSTISKFAAKQDLKNLKPSPEGFMSVTQICKALGIADTTWWALKVRHKVISHKMGGKTFYKKEDVDQISAERQKKATERMNLRLTIKPAIEKETDGEFEEMMEGAKEQNSEDLDLFHLHLAVIGQIPVEIKKHKLWGVKISSGQLAVRVLKNLLNSNLLDSSQERLVRQILETPRGKYFSKEFQLIVDSKLEKEKTGKINASDKKFLEVLQRLDLWLGRLKINNIPQVIDHQIKVFNSGSEAFDNLVTSNMRLVLSIAKKYLWSGFSISDLQGYGDEGLMKAAVKFDWRKDYRFSTYATWWIRQTIVRAVADFSDTIRVPVHMYGRIAKFKREVDRLLQDSGNIDSEELANEVDPTGNLAKSLKTRNLVSLNSPVGPNQDTFLEDYLEDVRSNMEDNSDKIGMRETVRQALDTLTLREKRVLELRYGLVDSRSRSLDQVAADLDKEEFGRVTRERIRQIESKALRKLRHPSRAKKLRPYFDDDPKSLIISPGQ